MKFKITMKDPDGVYECVEDAVTMSLKGLELSEDEREAVMEKRREAVMEAISKWFEYGECLNVEVDTDAGTIEVLSR